MPFVLFREIIDLICELGIQRVTLTGGEPTIYADILEAVRYCKDRGLTVSILTNGLAFASRDRVELFRSAGVDRIGLSLKAHDRQSHLDATGIDCFGDVTRAIANLAQQDDMALVILMVMTAENKDHLADMLRMAKQAGASVFGLLFCLDFGCMGDTSKPYCQEDIQRNVIDLIVYLTSHFDELNAITEGRLQISQTLPQCLWDSAFIVKLDKQHQMTTACQLLRHDGLIFDT